MAEFDESDISEITILPDGRLYAFGITRPIKEILQRLQSREDALAAEKRKCTPLAPREDLQSITRALPEESSRGARGIHSAVRKEDA